MKDFFRDTFLHKSGDGRPLGRVRVANSAGAVIGLLLIVAPAVFNMIDSDLAKNTITSVFGRVMPKMPVVKAFGPDSEALANHERDILALILYYFVLILVAFGALFNWARQSLRDKIQEDFSGLKESVEISTDRKPILSGLNVIRNRLDNAAKPDEVLVGIFDRLLIYSPLYVAEGVGYFREEGLTVDFQRAGDDRQVAAAVRHGDYLFGACDPFMCVPDAVDAPPSRNDLLILFPLVKRYGFLIYGRDDAYEKAQRGEPITIGAYEEGSTSYLVAQAFRRWLVDRTNPAPGFINSLLGTRAGRVEIRQINVLGSPLNSEAGLDKALRGLDFAVLWDPQSSWVLAGKLPELKRFGVVGVSSDDGAPLFKTFRQHPIGASGALETGWTAWKPGGSHQCLISAVVTLRSTVEDRPVLVRRMYRALARTCIHLHSVDWELDTAVFASVKRHLRYADGIDTSMLDRMVCGGPAPVADRERGGIFPFIYGWPKDHPYRDHLLACHRLWRDNGGTKNEPWNCDAYKRCFVDLENPRVAQSVT